MRNRQKAAKVRQMLRHHAAGVRGYKEADKILDELTDVMKPGDSVFIGGGQKATLDFVRPGRLPFVQVDDWHQP